MERFPLGKSKGACILVKKGALLRAADSMDNYDSYSLDFVAPSKKANVCTWKPTKSQANFKDK